MSKHTTSSAKINPDSRIAAQNAYQGPYFQLYDEWKYVFDAADAMFWGALCNIERLDCANGKDNARTIDGRRYFRCTTAFMEKAVWGWDRQAQTKRWKSLASLGVVDIQRFDKDGNRWVWLDHLRVKRIADAAKGGSSITEDAYKCTEPDAERSTYPMRKEVRILMRTNVRAKNNQEKNQQEEELSPVAPQASPARDAATVLYEPEEEREESSSPRPMGNVPAPEPKKGKSPPSPQRIARVNKPKGLDLSKSKVTPITAETLLKPTPPDTQEYRWAKMLYDCAVARKRRAPGLRTNLNEWADEFRKLRDIDLVPAEDIDTLLRWYTTSEKGLGSEKMNYAWCAESFRADYSKIRDKMYQRTAPKKSNEPDMY